MAAALGWEDILAIVLYFVIVLGVGLWVNIKHCHLTVVHAMSSCLSEYDICMNHLTIASELFL